ncbi:MAG: hypothetical protein H8D43_03760 [Chloroflexi bacterium]|nr:hypothetical protein [Chloroflexota bacterium]
MRGRLGTVVRMCRGLPIFACANPVLEHVEQGASYYEQEQWQQAIAGLKVFCGDMGVFYSPLAGCIIRANTRL